MEYLYTKTITTTINSLQNNCSTEPTIISDTTNRSYFTTGITRELITQQFFNNQNVITTETWITKKSSYCTLTNMSLMTALTIITGATLLLHHDDFVLSTSDHWLTYLLTHEKYKTKIIVSLSDKIINQKLICEQDILKAVGEMGLQQFKKMLK